MPARPPEPLFAALRLPHWPAQALAFATPALRSLPGGFAVVEQNPESHKTPLLAASEAARNRGVEAGIPAFVAARRWRGLPLLPRDPGAEERLRAALSDRLLAWTPAFSIGGGGARLDMAGTPATRRAAPEVWLPRLLESLSRLGLDGISAGAGASQTVARVLARLVPPGGARVCPRGGEDALLGPLAPEALPGLSPRARERFRKYGLRTVEQVRRLEREELRLRFGEEAEKIYCLARGLDLEAVSGRAPLLAAETVPPRDLHDADALRGQVRFTADKLGHALRQSQRLAGRITLQLRYADGRTLRRGAALHPPTAAFLRLAETAERLFAEAHGRRVALRRFRLEASVSAPRTGQIDLFDSERSVKQEALAEALARIRRKRSFGDVLSGCCLGAKPLKAPSTNPRGGGGGKGRERC